MPSVPLRVVLIGCGTISRILYRPALEYLEKIGVVRVVGLADKIQSNFEAFRSSFPHAEYSDELACHANLAIVAVPGHLHAPVATEWLGRGAAVLCEKPLAAGSEACRTLIEAAENAKKVLAVGHVRRFYPAVEAIRNIIARHTYGEVLDFRFVEGNEFSWPINSGDMFLPGNYGGVMADNGVHVADLIEYWFGSGFDLHYEDDAYGGVEANCQFTLSRRGLSGEVRISREIDTENSYWIVFERAALRWDPTEPSRFSVIQKENGPIQHITIGAGKTFERCFTDQLIDVIESVREGRSPRVGGEDGLKAVEFVDRCYRQRQPLSTEWMSIGERRAIDALHVSK